MLCECSNALYRKIGVRQGLPCWEHHGGGQPPFHDCVKCTPRSALRSHKICTTILRVFLKKNNIKTTIMIHKIIFKPPPPKGPDSFVLTYKIFETRKSMPPSYEVYAPLREILDPPLSVNNFRRKYKNQ